MMIFVFTISIFVYIYVLRITDGFIYMLLYDNNNKYTWWLSNIHSLDIMLIYLMYCILLLSTLLYTQWIYIFFVSFFYKIVKMKRDSNVSQDWSCLLVKFVNCFKTMTHTISLNVLWVVVLKKSLQVDNRHDGV